MLYSLLQVILLGHLLEATHARAYTKVSASTNETFVQATNINTTLSTAQPPGFDVNIVRDYTPIDSLQVEDFIVQTLVHIGQEDPTTNIQSDTLEIERIPNVGIRLEPVQGHDFKPNHALWSLYCMLEWLVQNQKQGEEFYQTRGDVSIYGHKIAVIKIVKRSPLSGSPAIDSNLNNRTHLIVSADNVKENGIGEGTSEMLQRRVDADQPPEVQSRTTVDNSTLMTHDRILTNLDYTGTDDLGQHDMYRFLVNVVIGLATETKEEMNGGHWQLKNLAYGIAIMILNASREEQPWNTIARSMDVIGVVSKFVAENRRFSPLVVHVKIGDTSIQSTHIIPWPRRTSA